MNRAIPVLIVLGIGVILMANGEGTNQVPVDWKHLTPAEALTALHGALPPDTTETGLRMVAAQSALETNWWGRGGGKGFANWNFGNITSDGTGPWVFLGPKGMRYRAYPSNGGGAIAYVAQLKKDGTLDSASRGDLDGYVAQLQKNGYLGFVGRTDPTGHTVTQADYDQYKASIAAIMGSLKGLMS